MSSTLSLYLQLGSQGWLRTEISEVVKNVGTALNLSINADLEQQRCSLASAWQDVELGSVPFPECRNRRPQDGEPSGITILAWFPPRSTLAAKVTGVGETQEQVGG